MENNNIPRESWFENKIGFLLTLGATIIGIVFGIFVPIWTIKMQMAVIEEKINKIETNDLTHIYSQLEQNSKDHKEIIDKLTEILIQMGKK